MHLAIISCAHRLNCVKGGITLASKRALVRSAIVNMLNGIELCSVRWSSSQLKGKEEHQEICHNDGCENILGSISLSDHLFYNPHLALIIFERCRFIHKLNHRF